MNVYLTGALWVLGFAAVAALGTIFVHRFTPPGGRNGNEAVTGVFAIVGGLHAVLLAFVLISLFDTVSSVKDSAQNEANALVAVYWASDSLSDPARTRIQNEARSYARTVIDQEWPSLQEGVSADQSGWRTLDRIRAAIDSAPAEDDWLQDRKSEAASQLWTVYEARQDRQDAAGSGGVSTVVWIALIVGSVLSLSLPYLFDGPKLLTHMGIMVALAGTIALLMFAIYQLQNPFSGGARVGPDAFAAVVDRFSTPPAG